MAREIETDLTALAQQILRDRYKPLAFSNSAFTVHDWVSAAEFALEGDFDDLRYYLAEDEAYEAEQRAESIRCGDDAADYWYDYHRDMEMARLWERELSA